MVTGMASRLDRLDHGLVNGHSKVGKVYTEMIYSLLTETCAPPLLLYPLHPSLPVCVHVRTQQAGSSPRAQMLSVNTEIPERKQGFTAASCTHSQALQRPGARRGQPAPHKHRPPCLLSEPLVLLPGSGWAWFRPT